MLCRLFVSAVFAFALAGGSAAQDAARQDRIEAAWADWLTKNGIARGTLAIAWQGEVVRSVGRGKGPGEAVPLASLSKSVTAACVKALVDEGQLTFDTALGDIAGLDASGDNGAVTIGALLTHSAGFWPDTTQQTMGGWLNEADPRHREAAADAFRHGTKRQRAGSYAYNNENYAVLGRAIDLLAGSDHVNACADRVLAPAGISATLSETYGAQGAWGGWEMSMSDYLRFVAATFGPAAAIGRAPERFPAVELGGGAFYGMGVLFRAAGDGHNFWHDGLHCYGERGADGTFFASWNGGWSVAASFEDCVETDAIGRLDGALWEAAHR